MDGKHSSSSSTAPSVNPEPAGYDEFAKRMAAVEYAAENARSQDDFDALVDAHLAGSVRFTGNHE